ncbi:MAG: CBS and ACT domain-containing protein [Actinomycetota bacterium]|nr:CBS and ACT domain-containing protein [Actinomycetota bacterium]
MLQVEDSMTHEVFTVTPETTAKEALAASREKRIRHFPVVENGRLVGIFSDRDLRSATPALGDSARAVALEEIRVSSVMKEEVVTAHPQEPIEQAANTMREKDIGCLPVVEEGALVGILTSSDVMGTLVYLIGAHEPGSRMEISVPDRPGALAGVAGIFGMFDINIVSVAMGARTRSPAGGDLDERLVVFRVDTIDPGEVVEHLEGAGYRVLWPPRPGA